ncbi:Rpp14/Pop5 family protein [Methanoregula sp.]|uniref:Rpp14/Pop5 family protein n=1 Tax=Methanoregula sp. TaxID=2052170 RepID=UPI002BF003D1|nr:Rpp14/Pop5 family protein [Methanoregula sp.]HVP95570.1 Rpp14/Pop5 family protein [Methanoregula sp.]
MSIRPPTLREKRRYVLARIDPAGTNPDTKDLYYAVYEAVVSLFGDMAAAAMQPSVLAAEDGYAILRCRRGAEREFSIALSTLTACRETPVALRVVAVSGTIESLRERIADLGPAENAADRGNVETPPAEGTCVPPSYRFGETPVEVTGSHGHKVDALEKGFKNTRRLFLTTEDLEIIHATTIPDGI